MPKFTIWISDPLFKEIKATTKRAESRGSPLFNEELDDEGLLERVLMYGHEYLKVRYP